MSDESVVDPATPRRRQYRARRTADSVIGDSVPPNAAVIDSADVLDETPPMVAGVTPEIPHTEPGRLGADEPPSGDGTPSAGGVLVAVDGTPRMDAPDTTTEPAPWRDGGRGPSRRRGRGGARPTFDGPPPARREGPSMSARPAPPRGPNSISAPAARTMRGASAPYGSSLGRMPAPGDASGGFRSIGRSPEDIARLAQEARREARLNRGRMFRAAAIGQSEPYRALGRATPSSPLTGANGNVSDRLGNGPARPPSRPGAPRGGRPPAGRA